MLGYCFVGLFLLFLYIFYVLNKLINFGMK